MGKSFPARGGCNQCRRRRRDPESPNPCEIAKENHERLTKLRSDHLSRKSQSNLHSAKSRSNIDGDPSTTQFQLTTTRRSFRRRFDANVMATSGVGAHEREAEKSSVVGESSRSGDSNCDL
ncbi:hypothetical protein TIFTF001_036845 [Ficus carica]|uniref:Uncharacterized protein n=1 Tax=Ficus carica TaxID=3494 RepID=A0AA88E463_FICCA|nr:hypothetical protein TIFTF001_036845 [Ficus carica]